MRTLNFKRGLLAGTAIVAVGAFATGAQAADVEVTAGTTNLPGAVVSGTDSIIDANDGADTHTFNLGGADFTFGDGAANAGIISTTGGNDASTVAITNTSATAATMTLEDDGTDSITTANAGAEVLNITIGEDIAGTDALSAVTVVVTGAVNPDADGTVNFTTEGIAGNVLTFQGNALDLGAAGVITLGSTTDEVNFDGANTVLTAANIRGGNAGEGVIDINGAAFVTEATIGATAAVGSISVADNSTATFRNSVTTDAAAATTTDISLESDDATIVFDSETGTAGDIAVTGYIDGTAVGNGVVTVVDSDISGGASDIVTFNQAIGGNNAVNTVNVGNGTDGGLATFEGTVSATTVNVLSGSVADREAYGLFDENVVATNINVTANNTGGIANARFDGNVTATAITLDSDTDVARAVFGVDTDDTGDTTVTGTIDGGAAGEGVLIVVDEVATTDDTVTFNSAIGATNRLASVTVGNAAAIQDLATNVTVVAANEGGHAVFNSTVNATTITLDASNTGNADSVTAQFVGNVGSADTTGFNVTAGDNANETATATINANLTATTVTLTDAAAAANATLIADAATSGGSITITANVVGGNDDDGIIQAGDGTSATNLTVTGTVGGAAANGGDDLEAVNSKTLSTLTFNEAVFADTATTEANSTITFTKGGTLGSTLSNTGTTEVGINSTLTIASHTDGGGTFVLNVSDSDGSATGADYGKLSIAAGTQALDTDDVSIKVTGLVATDAAVDVLLDGGDSFDEAKQLDDNSALYTFTAATNGNITASVVSTANITDSSSSKNAVDQLLSIGTAATGDLETVQDAVVSAGSTTVDDVAEATTSVNSNAGGVAAGITVGNQTASLNSARLASLRDGSAVTGMSAGNGAQGLKVWGQAFGTVGEQDERDGISGYDVDGYGIAVGVDTENLAENAVIGLAFSYADTEVDSEGLANANTEIDSYQIALYGDYDLDERTYISGQVSYMWSDNDTTRNPGGVSSLTANGDYDASQWGVRAELGRDFMTDGGLTITPSALVNYVHYDADGYTETGAGGASLVVGDADVDVFEIGVGVDAAWKIENNDGSYLKPVLSAGVRHDLIGDEYATTNTFTGGGSAFNVEGFDPAQTAFDVGAGVTYFSTGGWDLSAEYDYEFKSDYDAHSGLVKASYSF